MKQLTNWIFEDNLAAFLVVLGWITDYDCAFDDWEVIQHGVLHSDKESNIWYDYEFPSRISATFQIAKDHGSGVVFLRLAIPDEIEAQVTLAINMCAHFTISQ